MSTLRTEVTKLANDTILSNAEIAKICGCSPKTVYKYARSHSDRCKSKQYVDESAWKIKKVILLPDIHHPYHDKQALIAVNDFIVDYIPDEIIYMGDQMSLDSISFFTRNKPLLKESKRLYKEYKDFDNDILKVHESITRPDIKRVFMMGNHEYRVDRYIEEHSELDGIINIETHLNLLDRNYKIIPYNGVYKIAKLNIIHGYYWNKYHATKTLEAFGGSVLYGHVHNPQTYCKVSPIDINEYHMATSLPCLSNIKPEYKKSVPNFWVLGFGILEYIPVSGYYNLYTIIINNGKFIWNGKQYGNT